MGRAWTLLSGIATILALNTYVEYLTLSTWLLAVWPHLLRQRRRRGAHARVCFILDGPPWVVAVARLMARPLGTIIERLDFALTEVRDEKDLLLRLRIAFKDLAEFQQLVRAEPAFQSFVQQVPLPDRLPMYLVRNIVAGGFTDQPSIWRALYVVQVCAWHQRTRGRAAERPVLFVEWRAWPASLKRYAAQHGIGAVVVHAHFNLRAFLYRLGGEEAATVAEMARRLGRGDASVLRQQWAPTAPAERPARVALESYGHFNLTQPERYSDFHFWQQSQLPARCLLVLFKLAQDPLDEEKLGALARSGMSGLALTLRAAANPRAPAFPTFDIGRRLHFDWNLMRAAFLSPDAAWLRTQVLDYWEQRDYWARVFSSQGVKIFTTWYKYDAIRMAMADALRSLGGVMTVYQRAYESHPSSEMTLGVDIEFGFSKAGADIERRMSSVIPYYVVTGYLGDHRFDLLREAATRIRTMLREHGAERILAFFDENTLDDSRWYTGHEFARKDYMFLLERILEDSHLGLVLKPKVDRTLRQRLGPVRELLEQAEATGRCHVIEGGVLHSTFPPAVAALSADIAVHQELWAATAALEAALAGVPTLLLDRDNWSTSPLYQLGVGRVVFTDWDSLWNACQEHWDRPGEVPGFGDWSSMLDELDPFRDGRASERMGTYLHWLVQGFEAGLSRETVLADAAERYGRAWGSDKVIEVQPFIPYPEARIR